MAAGLMVGSQKLGKGYWRNVPPAQLLAVRFAVLIVIYYLLSMYYFGASFTMHGVNQLAHAGELLTLMLPFFISSCAIGIWLGSVTPRRELVTLVVLISSMPLIFSAGFIWPVEMIPSPIVWLSQLFPSTPAIQSFLELNQMGADWTQIREGYLQLWALAAVWSGFSYLAFRRSLNKDFRK